jgi:hypothetical protein
LLRLDVSSLTIFRYDYFDFNVNVADMVRELAFELDMEAKRKGDYSGPGELFRHAGDPFGDRGWSICMSQILTLRT